MDYKIISLSDELVFIRWYHTPPHNSTVGDHFVLEIKHLLEAAQRPLYFISDLRRGRIVSMRVIQNLAKLTEHPLWGGSTAFTGDPVTMMFVRSFKTFSTPSGTRNEIQKTPEEALSFLETLKPGITAGINWQELVSGGAQT